MFKWFFRFIIGSLFFSAFMSAVYVVVAGMYFHRTDPEGYKAYKETIKRDLRFADDWMLQFAKDGNQRRCRLLALPIGYRCFYYETFRELELRELTVPGILSFWRRGIEFIWDGDPKLAEQPLQAEGVPAEDKKWSQLWHWTKFISGELERAVRNSALLRAVIQPRPVPTVPEQENERNENG